jgi:hypothetical protein
VGTRFRSTLQKFSKLVEVAVHLASHICSHSFALNHFPVISLSINEQFGLVGVRLLLVHGLVARCWLAVCVFPGPGFLT